MAVKFIATIQRWKGLSTDTKPINDIKEGSTFEETDTGRLFRWLNSSWVEDLSSSLNVGKAVDIGNNNRRLLEHILIENTKTRELIEELLSVTKGA